MSEKGLYNKYIVTKASGKAIPPEAQFIVLRIDSGQYVDACREGAKQFGVKVYQDNPTLAMDIWNRIAELNKADGKETPQ